MKKVLITGATGFIGRHITEELLKRGYEVYAVSMNPLPETKNLVQFNLNLFDEAEIEKFLEENKFENLIHIAWYLGPKFMQAEENLDWVSSSLKLLKSFVKYGGKKVMFTGTMTEYDYSYGYLQEELTPLNNSSMYGKSKAALYELASTYAKQNGLDFKWPRIFNVYGPYERQTRLMPSVICSALKGEDVKLSHCKKIQDYLHVYDVASAIATVFESDYQGAINICSGTPVKLKDIVNKIAELLDYKGNLLYGEIEANFDEPFVVGSNEKLKSLGWEPKFTLEEGLKQTIDWWVLRT